MSGRFAGERAVVLGLRVAGSALARVLAEEGAEVLVSEQEPDPSVDPSLAGLGVEIHTGGHRPEHLDGATVVVASPGVPESAPVLAWARRRGIPVWSELEVGARLATVPYVAVTGTNGKTTVTEMVAAAMRAAGLDAIACGNAGHPFSLAVGEGHDALAVEVSSFQLRFHESFRPRVSVLTNLAPDHVDWHGSMEAYVEAKRQVYVRQEGDDVHVGNRDDPLAASVSRRAPVSVRWFTLERPGPGETGYSGDELVAVGVNAERTLGLPAHGSSSHRADVAAAATAAIAFGLDPVAAGRAVCAFAPLPHRGEIVAEVKGVRFIDDSKATNPHATLAAIRGMRDVVLIAGGRDKGIDLSPLAEAVPALAAVVAMGEAAAAVSVVFDGLVPVEKAGSIEEAVALAHELAPQDGTVLLAPACSSLDMFRDYAERGDRFAAAARAAGRRRDDPHAG